MKRFRASEPQIVDTPVILTLEYFVLQRLQKPINVFTGKHESDLRIMMGLWLFTNVKEFLFFMSYLNICFIYSSFIMLFMTVISVSVS